MARQDPRIDQLLGEARADFGFIPECYREAAFSPDLLARLHGFWRAVASGPLSPGEVLTVCAATALRYENSQQVESWRLIHKHGAFDGSFELYLVAPELISLELRPAVRAVSDFFENDGRFSDEMILELFRQGKDRTWLHHLLFAIGFATISSQLSFLHECEFDVEPAK